MAYCSTVLGSSEVLRVDVHRKHRLDSCVFLPDELVGRHDGAHVRNPRLGENDDFMRERFCIMMSSSSHPHLLLL